MGEEAYEEEGERCVIRTNPQLRIRPDEHFHRLFKPASKLLACKKIHNDTLLLQDSLRTS